MPTALRFYRDVLGFVEVETSGQGDDVGWAWLRHGEAAVMLNTAYEEGEGCRRPIRPASPLTPTLASSSAVRTWRGRTRTWSLMG